MIRVFKESFIYAILSCLIIIAMYVAFYDKVPTIKNLPEARQYIRSEEVKQFLGEQIEEDAISNIKTYEVTSSDLKTLQKKEIYEEGKSNPFAEYTEDEEESSNEKTTSKSQKDFSHSNVVEK